MPVHTTVQKTQHRKTTKSEHRKLLAEWWLLTDPSPTWRSLIRGLDWFEETVAADKIRNNAEPIQGTLSMCVCMWHVTCHGIFIVLLELNLLLCSLCFEETMSDIRTCDTV